MAVLYRQHRLDPFLATAAVDAAMEHWGNDLSKWTIAKLQELGPFFVYLSLQSLNSLDVDDVCITFVHFLILWRITTFQVESKKIIPISISIYILSHAVVSLLLGLSHQPHCFIALR